MPAIQVLASQPWVERLGWTLVHFLWQGALIAALYAIVRVYMRSSRPNTRYGLGCAALVAMIAAPLTTWSLSGASESLAPHGSSVVPSGAAVFVTARADSTWASTPALRSAEILPWVVAIWLAGAMAFWARLAGGWIVAVRMRAVLVKPAPPDWQSTLRRLGARIGVSRPVRLLVSALVEAPAVIGWLRPVVLVPVGALAGLPAEQLEALLIHELAHIRRHDYLVNILQSAAEALLFYHPAVWWISGHIRAERELCCDEVAVSVSGDALTYVRALAGLELSRPVHLRAAMAANGGSLADRISHLLGQTRPVSRTLSGPGILASAILLVFTVCTIFGQPPAAPRFDVASIKPHKNVSNVVHRTVDVTPGGRLVAQDATLQQLVRAAYGVRLFQISGGPAWATSDGYDIEAKAEANTSREQAWLMLRTLLEDRFKLKLRRDTKEMPVIELTVAKGGAKLPPVKAGTCDEAGTAQPGGTGRPPCGNAWIIGDRSGARIEGFSVVMGAFTNALANALGSIVIDKTGLTERFDLRLEFDTAGMGGGAGKPNAGVQPPSESAGPSIYAAIQQQLGLKLETGRGPVEILVIEHAEKPAEN